MCIVNNPGSWRHIFKPLEHSSWVGCTPTDLVYPFFIFCMGCAMAFSFSKYDGLSKPAVWKIVKRGLAIFLVGLLLNLFPFFPTSLHDHTWTFGQNFAYWLGHKRIFGVLQRIGMCYVIAGLIALWLKKPLKIAGAIVVLFAIYTGILIVGGNYPGPFTLEGTISRKIDVACVGANHVYHGYSFDKNYVVGQELIDNHKVVSPSEVDATANFDPEGPLGALTGSCTALLGFLIGSMILRTHRRREADPASEYDSPSHLDARIYSWSAVAIALGCIMSIWIPISKPLWSASYVLYAGGWAMFALAFFAFAVDVKGGKKYFTPFIAMGTNPLVAFITSGVLAKMIGIIGWSPNSVFGANEYTSLAYSILFMLVIFSIQWILYKKEIIIKL
jgi:predicted acyltransferase